MTAGHLTPEREQWVVAQAMAGADPDSVLAPLRAEGWDEQAAIDAVQAAVARFLERNADGGIHHICYEVDDILAARDRLKAQGARVLGSGEPRIGAHGKPVLFLHPKDFTGTLVELEQA